MQAFSGDARVSRHVGFANPHPLGCSFYSPQSSSAFKIQDGGYSVRSPKKYACIGGYLNIAFKKRNLQR